MRDARTPRASGFVDNILVHIRFTVILNPAHRTTQIRHGWVLRRRDLAALRVEDPHDEKAAPPGLAGADDARRVTLDELERAVPAPAARQPGGLGPDAAARQATNEALLGGRPGAGRPRVDVHAADARARADPRLALREEEHKFEEPRLWRGAPLLVGAHALLGRPPRARAPPRAPKADPRPRPRPATRSPYYKVDMPEGMPSVSFMHTAHEEYGSFTQVRRISRDDGEVERYGVLS